MNFTHNTLFVYASAVSAQYLEVQAENYYLLNLYCNYLISSHFKSLDGADLVPQELGCGYNKEDKAVENPAINTVLDNRSRGRGKSKK